MTAVETGTDLGPLPAASNGSSIIAPPGRWPSLGLRELYRYRSVAMKLALRNLKARYRQTLLGVVWVLVQPLALMLVLAFFFNLISRGGFHDIPFAVWFMIALSIWGPAMKVLNEGSLSIINNQQLVTRVYLPRPLIPASVALTALVDLGFTLLATLVVLLIYGYVPGPTYLVVPLLIAVAWATVLGSALLLASINVSFRDVAVALPFIERLGFFVSPILYPAEIVPAALLPLYYLNPMALVLSGFHWALAGAPAPPAWAWPLGTLVAVAILVGGLAVFRWREPRFADEL